MTSCKASTFFSHEVFRNCWLQTQEIFSVQKLKLDVSFLGLVFISWVTSKLRNSEEALKLSLVEIAIKVCSVQGESLPLTQSLTALWQNYCQDHTHPQAKLVGKIRENRCEFRVYSDSIHSGNVQLTLAGTFSALVIGLFVGHPPMTRGMAPCLTLRS